MSSKSYSSNTSETTSWITDAQDLKKTIPLFVILYTLYLTGQILLGWVRNKERLQQIQTEGNAKCTLCIEIETRNRELEVRIQISEGKVRTANYRAEQFMLKMLSANRRAAKAEELQRDEKSR